MNSLFLSNDLRRSCKKSVFANVPQKIVFAVASFNISPQNGIFKRIHYSVSFQITNFEKVIYNII